MCPSNAARDTMTLAIDHQAVAVPASQDEGWPRLLADIGGTNARFALQMAPDRIGSVHVLPCAGHATFTDALQAYLDHVQAPRPRHAALAIANPVQGDDIRMTNHHWHFSLQQTRRHFRFDTLLAVNDFTALAMALPDIGPDGLLQVGAPLDGTPGAPLGLVGAGTGLGVGGLVRGEDGRWSALQSEGGHATFSPANELEAAILHYCWRMMPHVSAERLVSGPGIELLYASLAAIEGVRHEALDTAAIVARALAGSDGLCSRTMTCFCALLGTVASNVAITLGATGGVFIGGGIVPRLGAAFRESPFRERFESKGRFSAYLARVPTWVITTPYPAFNGVAAVLARHLERRGSPVLH
jgi:glucokinase